MRPFLVFLYVLATLAISTPSAAQGILGRIRQRAEQAAAGVVDQASDAATRQLLGQVAKVTGDGLPVKLDERDAYPQRRLDGPFRPRRLAVTRSSLDAPLQPGDYTLDVYGFCTRNSVHIPGNGVPYKVAPLRGRLSNALMTLFVRGTAAGVSPRELMWLSVAVEGGLRYEEMKGDQKALVDRLIPEYRRDMDGDFLQQVDRAYERLRQPLKLASRDDLLGRMGEPGRYLREVFRMRDILRDRTLTYEQQGQRLYEGDRPQDRVLRPARSQESPWSEIRPGVLARFTVVGGNSGWTGEANRLDLRILPQARGSAEPVTVARILHGASSSTLLAPSRSAAAPAQDGGSLIVYSIGQGTQALMLAPAIEEEDDDDERRCGPSFDPDGSARARMWKERARRALGPAAESRPANEPVTCAYAGAYLSRPEVFKWAGLAALVSGRVGQQCESTMGGYCAPILAGNRAVFDDLFWQHLAYAEGGLEELRRIHAEGGLCDAAWDAWQAVGGGDAWNGGLDMLRYEQKHVLQPSMYDGNELRFWLSDTRLVEMFKGKILVSPVPGQTSEFPGSNIADFEERWAWVESTIWPQWQRYERDPANRQALRRELRGVCPSLR